MKNLTLFCILLLSITATAQNSVDDDHVFTKAARKASRGKTDGVVAIQGYLFKPEYRRAAITALATGSDNNSALAGNFLGHALYRSSRDSGILFFKKCTEGNDKEIAGKCAFDLGSIYMKGEPTFFAGTPSPIRDLPMAKIWFEKALALGYHQTGYADASKNLAMVNNALSQHYENGMAAYKANNMLEAFRLWSDASTAQKDTDAMNGLAWLYLNGWGVKKDAYEASNWYYRVGRAGQPSGYLHAGDAFRQLGFNYYEDAMKQYKLAAENGLGEANERMLAAEKEHQETDAMMRQRQQASDAKFEADMKKMHDYQNSFKQNNNPTTQSKSSTPNYQVPSKTPSQRDQESYDKMHKEAAQREKYYNDKWGR